MSSPEDTSRQKQLDETVESEAQGTSRPVFSNQSGLHPRLREVVQRHMREPWRQPLHAPTERVFEQVAAILVSMGSDRPLVIDAGCGTGISTRRLSTLHPGAMVLGLDQSAARLSRVGADTEPHRDGDVLWARVELASFWRLALQAGWQVHHHYLLYPNPWPKSTHLAKRWHGHPVFPSLVALGGKLELRSNWDLYVREFSVALGELGQKVVGPQRLTPRPDETLTPFEAKYHASGHKLWRLTSIN